jgi:hypothetical protein
MTQTPAEIPNLAAPDVLRMASGAFTGDTAGAMTWAIPSAEPAGLAALGIVAIADYSERSACVIPGPAMCRPRNADLP